MSEGGFADRLKRWLYGLPTAGLVAGSLAVTALFVTAAIYAYRTYDYVQHDNDFCLSCHLMVDPFERFSRSAHRDMGCKACHQPTIVARSKMALTQIIENPDSLETHAEVPNERCAECHIDGSPEEWTLIASSAGHRVHLESSDPNLQGLQCVQCHTTSLHEFAAADQTCGQAGCHVDVRVQLGRMSNLTIHCAACHAFSKPVPALSGSETLANALQPGENECLSCHAMRALVEMPEEDPHGGVCASCHNPHDQSNPADAVQTCGAAGCHTRPDTITSFHRGLAPGILQNCTACHSAHDFKAPGTECIDCHKDIDERGTGAPSMRMRHSETGPVSMTLNGRPDRAEAASPYLHVARSIPATRRPILPPPAAQQAAQEQTRDRRFRHAAHRGVECLECHTTDDTHGALTVITSRDCQSCHHSPRQTAGPEGCARCHVPGQFASQPIAISQELQLAGETVTRSLPFDHDVHGTEACTACHTQPLTLNVGDLACTQCHADHHEPDAQCTTCHRTPVETAHDVRSHLSCDGAGCHSEAPVTADSRTRSLCLACHQDQAEHRPGQTCAECHPLPPPGTRGTHDEEEYPR